MGVRHTVRIYTRMYVESRDVVRDDAARDIVRDHNIRILSEMTIFFLICYSVVYSFDQYIATQ